MVQITVNDELARAIVEAGQAAILVDSSGRALAHVIPVEQTRPIGMTDEHLAELERRMAEDDGTRYTWAEVKERLHSLEQLDPEVVLALQRMEDAKRGGTFYSTKEVLEHLHVPDEP